MPEYGGGAYLEYESELEETLPEKIRRNAKKIVAAIIVIAVLYLLYYYFIASLKKVEITIVGLDNASLDSARIEILSEDGKALFYKGKGLKHYTTTLREGRYMVIVKALDFVEKETMIDVMADEENSFRIALEKDLKTKIKKVYMPSRLYLGQNMNVRVILKNEGSFAEKAELKLEDGFSELLCEDTGEITIRANSEEEVNIKCTVPNEFDIPRGKYSIKKNFKIRIKYTKKAISKSVEVFLAPELKANPITFRVDPASKPKDRKKFKIYNKSKYAVEDLNVYFEITSAKENDPEEVATWIRFAKESGEKESVAKVNYIPPREDMELIIEVVVPPTAKEETIYGYAVIAADFLAEPIKVPLTIEVVREVEVKLELTLSSSHVSFTSKDIGKDKLLYIKVYNRGDLEVTNIRIAIENQSECTSEWLHPLTKDTIPSIPSKESRELPYVVKANSVGIVRCVVKAIYQNPLPPYDLKETTPEVLEIHVKEI